MIPIYVRLGRPKPMGRISISVTIIMADRSLLHHGNHSHSHLFTQRLFTYICTFFVV